ncbi:hypothetical protein Q1695_006250 [Nippostrongylus brasiliensis]|nr:hypothetical protein Q1695_006250 [Nippostrongylus brasiliensis]
MSEEAETARSELVASISSQVADGIGPIIPQLVDKKLKEEKKERRPARQPSPSCPIPDFKRKLRSLQNG